MTTTNTQAVHEAALVHLFPAGPGMLAIKPLDYMERGQFDRYIGACRSGGAQFHAAMKAQVGKIEHLSTFVDSLKDAGFAVQLDPTLAESLQQTIAAIRSEAQQLRGAAAEVVDHLAARGLKLWQFQTEGVAWLRTRTAGILGDDMGLGKTVQLSVAIPAKAPVLIICPAALKGNWVKELSIWRPDLYPTILSGRNSFRWPLPNEVIILNYDILPETLHREPRPGTVVIADEAHAVKSTKAQRSKRFRAICKVVLKTDGRTWLATGTPILNRPPELWSLLTHIGLAEDAFGSWPTFCKLFARNVATGKWGDPRPETAERLRRVMLRRRRIDVLPDLPRKQHIDIDTPVDLDPETLSKLDAVVAYARAHGIDIVEAMENAKVFGFESMSLVRAALATAKIPAMLEHVQNVEDSGELLVVASAHRAPIDLLATREGWKTITGDTPPEQRTAIVSAFQRGALKGIGLTIAAGGVGLTLTRAHQMLFVDLAWTPALNCQCEDRICRIGQTRGCLITRLVGDHDVERHVAMRLLEKQQIIEASVEVAAVQEGGHTIVTDEAAAALERTLAGVVAATAPASGVLTSHPSTIGAAIPVCDDPPF